MIEANRQKVEHDVRMVHLGAHLHRAKRIPDIDRLLNKPIEQSKEEMEAAWFSILNPKPKEEAE